MRVCNILDRWKQTNLISNWEYTNDRFQYLGIDNKVHNYFVDFKIINNDNSFYYLEVKGYEQQNDKLKWQSVIDAGYSIAVWFEEQIIENESTRDK